jgi:putative copper export protein
MKPFAITGVFGLALAVAGLGAINRYRVLPRLPTEAARARLTRLVAAEALLAAIVFGCTAVLAESTPKSHEGHMAHAAARLY